MLLGVLFMTPTTQESCEVSASAYLSDPDSGATNVRESPGGSIVLQINDGVDCNISIVGTKNGWFEVANIYSFETDTDLEIPGGSAWIHGSVLAMYTRNYCGQSLNVYDQPDEGSTVISTINEEIMVRPKDICNGWTKIQVKKGGRKIIGWIESDWLCGSAVTTCS